MELSLYTSSETDHHYNLDIISNLELCVHCQFQNNFSNTKKRKLETSQLKTNKVDNSFKKPAVIKKNNAKSSVSFYIFFVYIIPKHKNEPTL